MAIQLTYNSLKCLCSLGNKLNSLLIRYKNVKIILFVNIMESIHLLITKSALAVSDN